MSQVQVRLLSLAQDGRADALAELLASDAMVGNCSADFVDGSGLSPLGHAARLDSTATIEALLDAPEQVRSNIDFQSPVDGRTALHVAAFYGSLDALELLLRRGADAELRDQAGVCVREQAEVHEDSNSDAAAVRQAVESTLSSLANPVDLDNDDNDAEEHNEDAEVDQDAEGEADADAEAEDAADDLTEADLMLHAACREGHLDDAQLALDSGADPDRPDAQGLSPLMHAARGGHLPLVRLLIEQAAADRDAQHDASHRNTALMFAVRHGQTHCVEWMVSEGACAVFGLSNAEGESADTIRPVEKVTAAEMEAVFARALQAAEAAAVAHEEDGGDEQAPDEEAHEEKYPIPAAVEQDDQDVADEEERAAEAEYQRELAALEQREARMHQEAAAGVQPHERYAPPSAAAAAVPSRSYANSDARAFQELPLPEAFALMVERYRQTCADVNQQPSAFIEAALHNAAYSRALLLSGRDCEGAGMRKFKPEERLSDRVFAPLLEVLCFSFPQAPFRTIDLSANHLSSHSLAGLAAFLVGNSSVTSVDLSANDIDRLGGEALAHALARDDGAAAPPQLTKINLSHNPLGASALGAWASLLSSNTTLTELNLGYTDCETLPLMKLCTALGHHNRTLKRLNLDGPLLPSLNEEHSIHLARTLLASNKSLTALSLKGHHITDSAGSWLAEFLLPHPCLTELDLRRNELTTRGVAAFVRPIAHRRVEALLLLDGNKLTGQTFEEIEDAIAANQGSRNQVVFTSRQDKHSLRAKGPL
jgi:ankyrin repeat protein/Ran GTPase-activating protein (RanGAP) involved in mRNA processing and transport